jgi:hypothetical protein
MRSHKLLKLKAIIACRFQIFDIFGRQVIHRRSEKIMLGQIVVTATFHR